MQHGTKRASAAVSHDVRGGQCEDVHHLTCNPHLPTLPSLHKDEQRGDAKERQLPVIGRVTHKNEGLCPRAARRSN